MKILVVDDEQLLVKGIKFNLENEGYQVLTAYDGAAAVELARRESLDLIILDLMMPQLSGSEACLAVQMNLYGETPNFNGILYLPQSVAERLLYPLQGSEFSDAPATKSDVDFS